MSAGTRKQDAGKRLVDWAVAHGARVSEKVVFCMRPKDSESEIDDGDRTCMAMAAIDEDEVLIEIPRSITFETPLAETPPAGVPHALLEALSTASCSGLEKRSLAVALLVYHERARGDASHFAAYFDSLPASFSSMPLCDLYPPWSEHADPSEAKLYRGTNVERLAQAGLGLSSIEAARRMASLIEEIDANRVWYKSDRDNIESLRWTAAVVQSRAHSSKRGDTALVPLADSFNHSPACPNMELCEGPFSFQIKALCPVKLGEELLLSYGNFSNAELLFNAGFVCLANPHECVLVSRDEIIQAAHLHRHKVSTSDALALEDLEKRCDKLSEGLSPPRLTCSLPLLGGAIPAKVIAFVSGLIVSTEEFLNGVHLSWMDSSPRAVALRSEILLTLYELLENVLRHRYELCEPEKSIPGKPEQFNTISEYIKRQRHFQIVEVRAGERAVVTGLSAAVRARLPAQVRGTDAAHALKRLKTE